MNQEDWREVQRRNSHFSAGVYLQLVHLGSSLRYVSLRVPRSDNNADLHLVSRIITTTACCCVKSCILLIFVSISVPPLLFYFLLLFSESERARERERKAGIVMGYTWRWIITGTQYELITLAIGLCGTKDVTSVFLNEYTVFL